MRQRLFIKSDKDSHFTTTLAQHVNENENIRCNVDNATIDAVTLQADENLAFDIYFFRTDAFNNTDMDLSAPCGFVTFATTDGLRISGAGQYIYSKQGLNIPYQDSDGSKELHVMLVNRSASAKSGGASGEITVQTALVTNDF